MELLNGKSSIYLADLCYFHEWDNLQPIPLNVGYITAYLLDKHPEATTELFKDPIKLQKRISEQPPKVLALSHYDWNTNLNLAILRHAKEKNSDIITVMGGPNFEMNDLEWILKFFEDRPNLDVYITGEGELSFNRFIELLDTYGKISDIPFEELPASIFYYDKESKKIINNPRNFVERIDLTTIPSPYLTGILDQFLDDPHLAPIMETNRGCPYACTFCNWGNATQSKINQYGLDTVKAEIQYVTKRSKNYMGLMYLADGNFGILKRDLEIAKLLRECTVKENFPRRVFIYFAKNTNDTIINIASTLKTVTSMSMSKQTMNQEVLKNIKRENIPIEQYDVLREKCHEKGIETFCELIYGLPGENFKSFIDGIRDSARNNVIVTLYPNQMLKGSEQSTRPSREKFGIKTKFRVIHRYISSWDELPSLEYEEVVVETNDVSHDNWYQFRFFQFLFYIFRSEIFIELSHSLYINGLDYVTMVEKITHDEKNWTPEVKQLFNDYFKTVKEELFDVKKLEFTPEDIKKARIESKALNLVYFSKITTNTKIFNDFKFYLSECISRFFGKQLQNSSIDELKQTVNFAFDKLINYENLDDKKIIPVNYNISSWLDNKNKLPLEEFHISEPIQYIFELDNYVLSTLERNKDFSNDLTEAVYSLRVNIQGPTGDKVFCYRRTPLSNQISENIQLSKREAMRRHVDIAQR